MPRHSIECVCAVCLKFDYLADLDALASCKSLEALMQTIADLIVSRTKTCNVLREEIAHYESEIAKAGATSPAGVALSALVKVKKQRLTRVTEELNGFRALIPASPQMELPTKAPGKK